MTTFVTSELIHDKVNKTLTHSGWQGPFPEKIGVISSKTSRVVVFHADHRAAEVNEFWDGEMYVYKTWDSDLSHKIKLIVTR